ncbi:GyrI-like domain-containing protein [Galbibacter sp.]|jgi:effector-binding domain-containing protein|uniref:GyrI-like domain-containing protein n=1 Tax=Galbibacter sp. TaxID=2918471 RepID=UPI003A94FBD7
MKKIIGLTSLIMVCIMIWYLGFKKADYIYNFSEKASTGTVYYSISNWDKASTMVATKTLDSTLYTQLTQKLYYKGKQYLLYWDMENVNDSITAVSVGVKEPDHSLYNRVTAPFSNTEFKQHAVAMLTDFRSILSKNLSTFKVDILGSSHTPKKSCACVNVTTTPQNKAAQMMRYYNYINSFIITHDLQSDGFPMVTVNTFDKQTNRIDMDFCFPIRGVTSLPASKDIYFKNMTARPALKATFNGNYMYSHQAWFSLYDYAENHGLQLTNRIVEQFFNNPNLGGNALGWKTEIYIPIVEQ